MSTTAHVLDAASQGSDLFDDGMEDGDQCEYLHAPAGLFFLAREALAGMAEHTIDLQYFIWSGDASGRVLLERVLRAADRGVRVRILIDDLSAGRKYAGIATIEYHGAAHWWSGPGAHPTGSRAVVVRDTGPTLSYHITAT